MILPAAQREVVANVSDDVRLPCDVQTDSRELPNLVVQWRRHGLPVDPSTDSRLSVDLDDHSLHIRGALVHDTAEYSCHADNGLDAATSEPISVVVRGTSGAARGGKGEASPLWVDVQKLCNMCVMNVRKDR